MKSGALSRYGPGIQASRVEHFGDADVTGVWILQSAETADDLRFQRVSLGARLDDAAPFAPREVQEHSRQAKGVDARLSSNPRRAATRSCHRLPA